MKEKIESISWKRIIAMLLIFCLVGNIVYYRWVNSRITSNIPAEKVGSKADVILFSQIDSVKKTKSPRTTFQKHVVTTVGQRNISLSKLSTKPTFQTTRVDEKKIKSAQTKKIVTRFNYEPLLRYADGKTTHQVIGEKNCMMKDYANYNGMKVILFYNSFFNMKGWSFPLGQENFNKYDCEYKNCYTTHDKTFLKNASAVLFHKYELRLSLKPPYRHPNQRWVFMSLEAPVHGSRDWVNWNNLFNWTFTYKVNSDIPWPYGRVVKRDPPLTRNYVPIVKKKTRPIAWIVSHCGGSMEYSHRMEYVKELQKYIQVDIFGGCGTKKCPRQKEQACMKMLNETYKFYLSFENNFCSESITEKFYKIMALDVVPIVRGAASHSDYSKFLPSKYFIDTRDFKSPKSLGTYLQYLNKNDTAYIEYLKRMDYYLGNEQLWSTYKPHSHLNPLCVLCKKLNEPEERRKWYSRLDLWFSLNDCGKPPDMKWVPGQ